MLDGESSSLKGAPKLGKRLFSQHARNISERRRREKLSSYLSELNDLLQPELKSDRVDTALTLQTAFNFLKFHNEKNGFFGQTETNNIFSFIDWETLLSSVLRGFFVVANAEGSIRYASTSAVPILGISQEEIYGRKVQEFIHPSNRSEFERAVFKKKFLKYTEDCGTITAATTMVDISFTFNSCISCPRSSTEEYVKVKCSGRWRTPALSEKYLDSDTPLVVISFMAGEEQALLGLVSDSFTCRTTLHGDLAFVDTTFASVLGYASSEVVNQPIYNFIHPEDIQKAFMSFSAAILDRASSSFVCRFRSKSLIWVLLEVRVQLIPSVSRLEEEYLLINFMPLSEREDCKFKICTVKETSDITSAAILRFPGTDKESSRSQARARSPGDPATNTGEPAVKEDNSLKFDHVRSVLLEQLCAKHALLDKAMASQGLQLNSISQTLQKISTLTTISQDHLLAVKRHSSLFQKLHEKLSEQRNLKNKLQQLLEDRMGISTASTLSSSVVSALSVSMSEDEVAKKQFHSRHANFAGLLDSPAEQAGPGCTVEKIPPSTTSPSWLFRSESQAGNLTMCPGVLGTTGAAPDPCVVSSHADRAVEVKGLLPTSPQLVFFCNQISMQLQLLRDQLAVELELMASLDIPKSITNRVAAFAEEVQLMKDLQGTLLSGVVPYKDEGLTSTTVIQSASQMPLLYTVLPMDQQSLLSRGASSQHPSTSTLLTGVLPQQATTVALGMASGQSTLENSHAPAFELRNPAACQGPSMGGTDQKATHKISMDPNLGLTENTCSKVLEEDMYYDPLLEQHQLLNTHQAQRMHILRQQLTQLQNFQPTATLEPVPQVSSQLLLNTPQSSQTTQSQRTNTATELITQNNPFLSTNEAFQNADSLGALITGAGEFDCNEYNFLNFLNSNQFGEDDQKVMDILVNEFFPEDQ